MAKQRREIEVFTVSSLNLLSKALGAVILLFIIIPKVTFKQRNLLDHLPKNLDSLAKNPNLLFLQGDSVGTMLLVDSTWKKMKEDKQKIEKRLAELDGIKAKISNKDVGFVDPSMVSRHGKGNASGQVANNCSNDKEPPILTNCPTNIMKQLVGKNNNCTAVTWNAPTATDNCNMLSVTMSTTPTANLKNGGCFPEGTTMVSYLAKDLKGNQSQCSFAVTVKKDYVPPPTVPRDTSIAEKNKDLPPFPCTDPVCIYLQWTGEKDVKVEMSAQHDGKWSGYENFGDSRSWMKMATVKRANFKLMRQEGAVTPGDYGIQAYLRSGATAKVSGVVILNSPKGVQWRKLPEITLTKGEKTIVGTVGLQPESIEIK